jgi:hypothetical protein
MTTNNGLSGLLTNGEIDIELRNGKAASYHITEVLEAAQRGERLSETSGLITVRLCERGGNSSLFGEDADGRAIKAVRVGAESETPDRRLQEWLSGLLTPAGRRIVAGRQA